MSTPTTGQRNWNDGVIDEFRANGGVAVTGNFAGRQLLLLTTTGARSGAKHTLPLAYTRDGDRWIVVASKGGAPTHPDWYHNLLAAPHATIEMLGETIPVTATDIKGPERDRLYAAHEALHPEFRGYPPKTDRVIPVIALERDA